MNKMFSVNEERAGLMSALDKQKELLETRISELEGDCKPEIKEFFDTELRIIKAEIYRLKIDSLYIASPLKLDTKKLDEMKELFTTSDFRDFKVTLSDLRAEMKKLGIILEPNTRLNVFEYIEEKKRCEEVVFNLKGSYLTHAYE